MSHDCIHCGAKGVAYTHTYDTCPAVLAKKQNQILKDGFAEQKKFMKDQQGHSGFSRLIATIFVLPFAAIIWGMKNHKEIDNFNKVWLTFCLKHWKILSASFLALIILAAIVGGSSK